jgi:NADH-quinone oxidoreductase subunit N
MKQNFIYFLPETVLIATILILIVIDFFSGVVEAFKGKGVYSTLALIGLAGMMAANCYSRGLAPAHFFSNMVTLDGMTHFFKYIFGTAGILGILMSIHSPEVEKADQPSYYTLLTALVLGMMLLASANHLLMVYLSLEMVSVLSYILTGSVRGSRRSSEAALKYVIYGGVASGVMLFGMSLLYGLANSTSLATVQQATASTTTPATVVLTMMLCLAKFGYKIASVPFHM